MTSTLEKAAGFEGHFAQLANELKAVGPERLHDMRREGMRMWNLAGWPTHKDEEWKYTSLREAAGTDWTLPESPFVPSQVNHVLAELRGVRLDVVNGIFSSNPSAKSDAPDFFAGSLRQALEARTAEGCERAIARLGKIATLDGKLGTTNDERFKHLNTAFLSDGIIIHVPKGVIVENPIIITYTRTCCDDRPTAIHPRALIVLEEGAQAKVVEIYRGDGAYFTNAVTEIHVGERGILEHVRVQDESRESLHIGLVAAHQEANSTLTSYSIQFGSKVGRVDVNLWVNGEHAESRLDGVYVASGEQVLDNKTRIDHAKPNCHSFEAYKGILAGKAVGVFNGKIFVYEDAQKTDAKQTNQALLLSKTATINTKPQLEIFADDVKCTHGATIGQLREDAMFYLRARGIPEKEARALLVYAFAADVLERISLVHLREALEKELYRKLHEETGLETASIDSVGE